MKNIINYILFLMIVFASQLFSQKIFIPKGAVWKYLDNGTNQETSWQDSDFNDSSWASGPAQLGYNEGDEATLLSYGPDPNNKYITTYFRNTFEITDSTSLFNLLIKLLRDDGSVVYLNGTEVVRSNMPTGTITYTTKAASAVAGSAEDTFYEFYIDASLLKIGKNVVAVEIHQSSGGSSDISFDFEMSATTSSPSIIRKAPYLIYTGINTEYKILWQLNKTEGCELKWGTDVFYSNGSVTTTEYGNDHQHQFTFTDLIPNTKYYYKVIVDTTEYTGSFNSAPEDNVDHLKFLVYGDNRSHPEDHDKVAMQIINLYKSEPEYQSIIMNVGDMVNNGELEEDWDGQFFNPKYLNIQELLSSMGIQAARGNHEGNGVLLKKYFPYPYSSNYYWSFDYGPAHFAVVDQFSSYSAGSTQYNWLKNDLESTTKKWKFIILHAPGWSAGGHSNSSTVQNDIQPLCEQNNVKIVFAGHNHYYARAEVNGVMHITTGGGGAPLYYADANYPHIVKTSKSNHFCKISLNGDELVFIAINSSGNPIDAFQIMLTDLDEDTKKELSTQFSLEQNYPNPFNPITTIQFNLLESSDVTLNIYNSLGQLVMELENRKMCAGHHTSRFDASNLSSGIYFYKLKANRFIDIKKMVLLK